MLFAALPFSCQWLTPIPSGILKNLAQSMKEVIPIGITLDSLQASKHNVVDGACGVYA